MTQITGKKHSYLSLDKDFYAVLNSSDIKTGEIVMLNDQLAKELGINKTSMSDNSLTALMEVLPNSKKYFSQAYAGHQYGYFTMLGDGRAVMIGEVETDKGTFDIQLKGSGKTPYSRRGDGKATLYSTLREYLISEAMNALGVPTTRSLAVIDTKETIVRRTVQKGGMLSRVASSHLRVGTFQYVRATGTKKQLQELADYAINKHYPGFLTSGSKYKDFLVGVMTNQAKLIAKWQSIGFVHGVMNTDNMTISGETIDYGPCAFLDHYEPTRSFSSIDQNGRYAYQNQPAIASWNLARFAESILPLLSNDEKEAVQIANDTLKQFKEVYRKEFYLIMGRKIGIIEPTKEEQQLIDELLKIMELNHADFTNTYRLLTIGAFDELPFYNSIEWKEWFILWTRFLGNRNQTVSARIKMMEEVNPVVIPRNLLVEEALSNASEKNDYTLFNDLLEILSTPYNYKMPLQHRFIESVMSDENYVTYCGT